eukprot:TRINITY_DN1191_c0_g1_i2.p1 TRINITY_DN1191_c0_g1~~TRINITY_DN1191_c0_g1_i2.p1  ORF type:complete len:319 (+),score=99.87 TRINITY_DN1191_c0_g1_i2:125-1081(+)
MTICTVAFEVDGKKPFNANKDDLVVVSENNGATPKFTIMGGTGGSYHVGFTPADAGQYWLDFRFKEHWSTEPFMLPIKDKTGKVPDVSYTGSAKSSAGSAPAPKSTPSTPAATKTTTTTATPSKVASTPSKPTTQASKCTASGSGLTSANDTESASFEITANDASGNKMSSGGDTFDVDIEGAENPQIQVTDNKDGTYSVSYGPVESNEYKLNIKHKGEHISGSPFTLNVTETPISGELTSLTLMVTLRGKDGEDLKSSGDEEHLKLIQRGFQNVVLKDIGDGQYSVDLIGGSGENFLDIKLRGQSLEGLPVNFVMTE